MQGHSYVQVEYIKADGNPNDIWNILNKNDCYFTQYNQKEQLIINTYSKHANINLQELMEYKSKGMIKFTGGQTYILIQKLFSEIQRLQLIGIPHFNIQSQYIWILFELDNTYKALSSKRELINYKVRLTNFLLFQKYGIKERKDDKLQLIEICQQLIQYTIRDHSLKEDYWNQFNNYKNMTLEEINLSLQNSTEQLIDEKKQKLKKQIQKFKKQKVMASNDAIISTKTREDFQKQQRKFIFKYIKNIELYMILQPIFMHQLNLNAYFYQKNDQMIHNILFDRYTLLLEYFELNFFEQRMLIQPIDDYYDKILKVQNIYTKQDVQQQYQSNFIHYLKINGYLNSFEQFLELDKFKYKRIKTEIKQQLYLSTLHRMQEMFNNSQIYLKKLLAYPLSNFEIQIIIIKDTQVWFQKIIDQKIDESYPLKNRILEINEKLQQYFKIINQYIQELESIFLDNLKKQIKLISPLNLTKDERLQAQIIQLVDDQFKYFKNSELEQFMVIDLFFLLDPIKQQIFDLVKVHFQIYIKQLVEIIFQKIITLEK